jgi:hypothetical protein
MNHCATSSIKTLNIGCCTCDVELMQTRPWQNMRLHAASSLHPARPLQANAAKEVAEARI